MCREEPLISNVGVSGASWVRFLKVAVPGFWLIKIDKISSNEGSKNVFIILDFLITLNISFRNVGRAEGGLTSL